MGVAFSVAFCARLGDDLEALDDLFVKDMRVTKCVPDVGVIEHPLHELQVASLAQRLGRKIVPEIVEAEAGDRSDLAQPVPVRTQAGERDRIAPALLPIGDASAPQHR